MRKWIKRIFVALGILVVVLFLAVYFGGRLAAQRYLARDLKVGDGKARLVNPEFRWSLDLNADSVLYDSPTLMAAAGRTRVSANLFKSLLHFGPSVTLDVDTLALRIMPGPDTVKPKKDSIPFPDFKLPGSVTVRAGRILVSDTAGLLVQGDGVELETPSERSVRVSIREARARQTGDLRHGLTAAADWNDSAMATLRVGWKRAGDTLALDLVLPKSNLLKGTAEMRAHLASSEPYAKALKLAPTLPLAQGLDAEFKGSMPGTLRLEGSLRARVSRLPDSLPIKLNAQRVAIKVGFRDTAGIWSVASRGEGGEDVKLGGNLYVTGRDSLAVPGWLVRHAGLTAKGHMRGFAVTAAGKRGNADLEVADLRASADAIKAEISTGDGSRITADLKKAPEGPGRAAAATKRTTAASTKQKAKTKALKAGTPVDPPDLPDWNGAFSLRLAPGERWLVAFTDTNIVFETATITGRISGGEVRAVAEMTGFKAYGVVADSVRLNNRYGRAGYVLEPSHLYWRGVDWGLSGTVGLNRPGMPMTLHVASREFGSCDGAMPRLDLIEVHAKDIALDRFPYVKLDSLKANQPRVTGDFRWDITARTGSADLRVTGKYKAERLQAQAKAEWDPRILVVKESRASLSGNEITASARISLHGGQFFELSKLAKEDFEEVSLGADRFDLAKALAVAMPEPPLKSGTVAGHFSYNAASGFAGTYKFQDIRLGSDDGKIVLKELAIFGKGDSLIIKAVTASPQEPLFNDSATLYLTGVLAKDQGILVRARLGQKVFLDFRGNILAFKELKGRLGVRGDAVLPGSSGELRDVQVRADLAMPFKDGMKGLRLEADTLRGNYLVAGLDTQSFSAPVKMQGGKIAVPRFTMRSRAGAEMNGRFEMDPATQRMSGSLAGNSFAAQFGAGDRIKLRNVKLDLRGDSTSLEIQASIGSGSAEHIKAPMRAAGDFSRVDLTYRTPLGKNKLGVPGGGRIPFIRVDATLDSSEIRYRLRSMETLQNLFKRSPERRTVKRSQAMQVQINLETAGTGNSIETDILRVNYVGNFSMAGTYPYALVQGRISSQRGELGAKKQAYAIRRMDVKWLNTPLEAGKVALEAQKRLARNCEAGTLDSCNIITRLTGELSDLQFTYDSDCQGASGAGVEVSALVYSVRRGCYSSGFSAGGSGLGYEEQALALLEPVASQYLSDAAGKLSGHWISSAQVTGFGALASKKKSGEVGDTTTSTQEAISLELLSREFWRTRLRVRSAYAPQNDASSSPWNYRLGLEWRPPLPAFVDDPKWRRRLNNNVNVEAAIFTDPDRTLETEDESSLRKRLGLNYTYDFWGSWWAKKGPARPPEAEDNRNTAVPLTRGEGKTVALPDSLR
ncbi:MAG: hypothetical protein JWP91_949 [Fibrobacteres bacterium]|nr:hypothetical protein [Fibrobacterota bacterium]